LTDSRYFTFPITKWGLAWWGKTFDSIEIQQLFKTSISIALCVTVISVSIALFGALAFARYDWKGRGIFQKIVLLPMLVRQLRSGEFEAAHYSQNRAIEFALTLTVPAAAALIAIAGPIVTVLFQRGVFDATRVASRIQQALSRPFRLVEREIFTTASIGIAVSETGYTRPEEVLRDADTAITPQVANPGGATLAFSAQGLPPGLSINPATGTIEGAASSAGRYLVEVGVSDGLQTVSTRFTWTVNEPGTTRDVLLEALSEVAGNPWTAVAELNLIDDTGQLLSRGGWTVTASSAELTGENGAATNARDGRRRRQRARRDRARRRSKCR